MKVRLRFGFLVLGQGGREVGQKANQLPGYRHIDVPEEREYIAKVWGIPVDELPWEGQPRPRWYT